MWACDVCGLVSETEEQAVQCCVLWGVCTQKLLVDKGDCVKCPHKQQRKCHNLALRHNPPKEILNA